MIVLPSDLNEKEKKAKEVIISGAKLLSQLMGSDEKALNFQFN